MSRCRARSLQTVEGMSSLRAFLSESRSSYDHAANFVKRMLTSYADRHSDARQVLQILKRLPDKFVRLTNSATREVGKARQFDRDSDDVLGQGSGVAGLLQIEREADRCQSRSDRQAAQQR